jgi:hypothetical protein
VSRRRDRENGKGYRKYSPEFREEVARLVIDTSRAITYVAREYGCLRRSPDHPRPLSAAGNTPAGRCSDWRPARGPCDEGDLRWAAARRDIWRPADLLNAFEEVEFTPSLSKVAALWSGMPISVRPDDLDKICAALGCTVADLLKAEYPAAAGRSSERPGQADSPAVPPGHRRGPAGPAGRCRSTGRDWRSASPHRRSTSTRHAATVRDEHRSTTHCTHQSSDGFQ